MPTITLGSRRSLLAQTQTRLIGQLLQAAWPDLQLNTQLLDTQGDLNRRDPLPTIGGKGLFTLELENALRQGEIDLAVHSLKDLPIEDSPGLTIVAVPERATPHDMLISRHATRLEDLPEGAIIGTSSLRRAAQILAIRPDMQIKDIRGNVDTRLRKLDDSAEGYTAIILAQAGLNRLGYHLDYARPIPFEVMLPAPGQGALGVQGRADDESIRAYMQSLDHADTRAAVTAERAFLAGLGGGCALPVAALATINDSQVSLQALVAKPDGLRFIKVNGHAPITDAAMLGQSLAQEALAHGARQLLA